MLNLFKDLFGESVLVVQGVAEAHPASILNNALNALGMKFDGQPEDGPIDLDYLREMAKNERVERAYWDGWKHLVSCFANDYNAYKWAAGEIERAQSISLEERRMVQSLRPKTLYVEGCSEFPSSVVGLVAKRMGSNVVCLDEGFEPYLEWQKSKFKIDLSYVQRGREAHWLQMVRENKPHRNSLMIAGRSHLITPSQEDILKSPSRRYIGNFPDLLRCAGIRFSMYADLSQPELAVRAAPALYRA
ncbi:MAG: hypothetical protein HY515_04165 [Candidatus Aenigmarchaeota archaeon]|nr:hypothetical protein [Candidatus Aenigmarchaeota archaeon]